MQQQEIFMCLYLICNLFPPFSSFSLQVSCGQRSGRSKSSTILWKIFQKFKKYQVINDKGNFQPVYQYIYKHISELYIKRQALH